jgi:Ca-activated chloride channel family protein
VVQPSTLRPSTLRRRIPLLVAVVFGVVLVVVVRNLVAGDSGDGRGGPAAADRRDCIPLNVTASSEKAALLSAIADDYHQTDRKAAGRCVEVRVSSKASGAAAEALARGWNERVDGPRPDVWSPAARSWTVLVRQRTQAQDKGNVVPDDLPSIAQTPLVIAMPRPMAQALGWPDRQLGWSDVLALARDPRGWGSKGHAEWGRFKLGKTNPNFSTSGLNATIATYFAATGRSSDLTIKDVRNAKVVDYVRGVEGTVVHYGDTTLTFLQNLYDAAAKGQGLSYISAVTVEEKSVWDYNQGNPSGNPETLGRQGKPRTPLVAIYPKEGTLLSDNPYAVLKAQWVDAGKQAAAKDFLAFLRGADQQRRFTDAAFRSFEGRPGGPVTQENGLLPNVKYTVIEPPAPKVLNEVAQSWSELRKRARVLMVIDVSGSMQQPVPDSGDSRLELAKKAALQAVGQLAPDDQLGLWAFSTEPPGTDQPPYRVLVEPGPVGRVKGAFTTQVKQLVADGGTALYATTRAAVRSVHDSFDPDKINAVVLLTDGKNEYDKDNNLNSLLDGLDTEGGDVSVRVFPIAYGGQADLSVLQQIGKAARATAYDATNPATIEQVMTAVLSNF